MYVDCTLKSKWPDRQLLKKILIGTNFFCFVGIPLAGDRDTTAVFCNNELNLDDIDVYGFDYDYTLASYKPTLHYVIYNMGRKSLVKDYNVSCASLPFPLLVLGDWRIQTS